MYFVGHFGFFNSFRGTFYYVGLSGCQSRAISRPIKCQPLHVWYNVTRLSYKCSTKFLKSVFFLCTRKDAKKRGGSRISGKGVHMYKDVEGSLS